MQIPMIQYISKTFTFSCLLFCSLIIISCSTTKKVDNRSTHLTHKNKETSKTRYRTKTNRIKSSKSHSQSQRLNIVQATKKYIGKPYKYGGKSSASGFDCSGFTAKVYQENGVDLNGASYEQAKMGKSRSKSTAQPGDLVTFARDGKVFHVAIVTDIDSDHVWVAHSTSSKGVVVNEIWNSNYWRPKIHEFRNVVN